LYTISDVHIGGSNLLEMRKLDLINVGDELYEVVRRYPMTKFKNGVYGESANTLKRWAGCEKILMAKQTNEYLFVNLIPEAQIESENDEQRTSESQS
jgi:hypothetical protein